MALDMIPIMQDFANLELANKILLYGKESPGRTEKHSLTAKRAFEGDSISKPFTRSYVVLRRISTFQLHDRVYHRCITLSEHKR